MRWRAIRERFRWRRVVSVDPFLSSRSARNVLWNVVGGLWVGILTVLVTPWFVDRLGMEGYGLVGLWLMMQVTMGLLDLGMGATLNREFASSQGGGHGSRRNRDLLRTFEWIHWSIAAVGALVLILGANWVAESWLRPQSLPRAHLATAVRAMAIALGLQLPSTLYLNGLAGLQSQGRMNALQVLASSLRYGGGAAVLYWKADLVWFFATQAIVAAVQTLASRRATWRLLAETGTVPAAFRGEELRRLWRFAIGMALTASSAVLLYSADRIFLSRLVPTDELGRYAVAYTASGLLQMGILPFYRALLPRYAELAASGDTIRLREEYFRSCSWMAAVVIPLGITGWAFAPQLFHAWLGHQDQTIVRAFRWLLPGITLAGLGWLPAAFQQAQGWTRLHVGMMLGSLLLGACAMPWTIRSFGAPGAAAIWLVHGVLDITLGLWMMHRRLLVGELLAWYRSVVLAPLSGSLLLAGASRALMPDGLTRWGSLGWLGATGATVIALGVGLVLVRNFGAAARARQA